MKMKTYLQSIKSKRAIAKHTAAGSYELGLEDDQARFNKLMVFGCSHTLYGHIYDEPTSNLKTGHFTAEGSWNDIVANEYGLSLDNRGQCGSANYWIYQRVIQALESINDQTLVIVQWSYESRAVVKKDHCPIHPNLEHPLARSYYEKFYMEDQEISKMLGWTLILSKLIPNFYFDFCDGCDYINVHSPQAFASVEQLPGYLGLFGLPFHNYNQSTRYACSHLNPSGQQNLAQMYMTALSRKDQFFNTKSAKRLAVTPNAAKR